MTNREATIHWTDPAETFAALPQLDGLAFLEKMIAGELPGPPIASHFGMELVEVSQGTATFRNQPELDTPPLRSR